MSSCPKLGGPYRRGTCWSGEWSDGEPAMLGFVALDCGVGAPRCARAATKSAIMALAVSISLQ